MLTSSPIPVHTLDSLACDTLVWRMGGRLHLTVVAKATFELAPAKTVRLRAPLPLVQKDKPRPNGWGIEEACEVVPYLGRVGVLLRGHAYAHTRAGWPQPSVTASLGVARQTWVMHKRQVVSTDPNAGGLASFGPIAPQWAPRSQFFPHHAGFSLPEPEIPEGFDWRFYQPAPPDQQFDELIGDEWLVLEGVSSKYELIQTRLPSARVLARCTIPGGLGTMPREEAIRLVADLMVVDADAMTVSLVFRGHCELDPRVPRDRLRVVAALEMPGKPAVFPPAEPARPEALSPTQEEKSRSTAAALRALMPDVPPHLLAAMNMPVGENATLSISNAKPTQPIAPFALAEPGSQGPAKAIPGAPFRITGAEAPPPSTPSTPSTPSRPSPSEAIFSTVAVPPPMVKQVPDAVLGTLAISGKKPDRPIAPFALAAPGTSTPAAAIPGAPFRSQSSDIFAPPGSTRPPPVEEATVAGFELPSRPAVAPPAIVLPTAVHTEELRTEATTVPLPAQPLAPEPVPVQAPAKPVRAVPIPPSRAVPQASNATPPPAPAPAMPAPPPSTESAQASAPEPSSLIEKIGLVVAARMRTGASLADLVLAGADLRDVDLSGAVLDRQDLRGVNLAGVRLVGASLAGADLSGADLSGADLSSADLSRADLSRATLDRATFEQARLGAAMLISAHGVGARFVGAKLEQADLRNAKLTQCHFEDAHLCGIVAGRADLSSSRFTRADLAGASLRGARMTEADLTLANMAEADLREANLDRANLYKVVRTSARMAGATLRNVVEDPPAGEG